MFDELIAGTRRGLLTVKKELCQGCQACVVACSLIHNGQVIPSLARIQVLLDPFQGNHAIRYCHQCGKAPCANACPRKAIYWQSEVGHWTVDEALCIGCGNCVEACPFDVLILHNATNKALICDLCHGQPACVASCPTGALAWKEAK